MSVQRYPCPRCGRAICATDVNTYSASGRSYVYLRRHNSAPGVRCRGMAVRVIAARQAMEELLERSSLGTPGAMALQARTPADVVERIRRSERRSGEAER